MDGGYFLLRTRPKVDCEAGLLFLAYNMKRVLSILGFHELMLRLGCFAKKSHLRLFVFFASFLTRAGIGVQWVL